MSDSIRMTAARIHAHGGPEVLTVDRIPVPTPAPGQVRIRVTAAALNNTDLWTREGAYGTPDDPDAPMNPKQAVLLRDLCEKTGEEFDTSLTEAQADERIRVLQDRAEAR